MARKKADKTTKRRPNKVRAFRTPKGGADWSVKFLAKLAETGVVKASAFAAGVGRRTVYQHKDEDPAFAQAFADAMADYNDTLEQEAHRRAVDGVEKGVWHQGEQVGTELVYSDQLLLAKLRKGIPEYREKGATVTATPGTAGGAVTMSIVLPDP